MGQTLSQVVTAAVAHCCDASKQHLDPAHDRHHLSNDAMRDYDVLPYPRVYAFFKMEFQICANYDLGKKHKHEGSRKGGMYIALELPAFMGVSKEVCDDRDDSTEGLTWNMPPRTNDLEGEERAVSYGISNPGEVVYIPQGPCRQEIACQMIRS
jgi:hypothetical protein